MSENLCTTVVSPPVVVRKPKVDRAAPTINDASFEAWYEHNREEDGTVFDDIHCGYRTKDELKRIMRPEPKPKGVVAREEKEAMEKAAPQTSDGAMVFAAVVLFGIGALCHGIMQVGLPLTWLLVILAWSAVTVPTSIGVAVWAAKGAK